VGIGRGQSERSVREEPADDAAIPGGELAQGTVSCSEQVFGALDAALFELRGCPPHAGRVALRQQGVE
jgi:hypothetical protein